MDNWWKLSHLFVGVFLSNFTVYVVNPAITDVIVEAVCRGKDECSLAIYLTGFQQAVAGLGAVVVMPVLGNLSDVYGRKTLLLIPLGLSIFPSAILAWRRSTKFFYAYYAIKIPTAMITDGGVICLSLAYLTMFVKRNAQLLLEYHLFGSWSYQFNANEIVNKPVIQVATAVVTFSLLAGVAFFNSIAEAGIQSFLLYFLKARFHFKKNQFADILLITYAGATVSSMFFLPVLGPFIGEVKLLIVGLFAGFLHMFINSIAWSAWVPYAFASLGLIFSLVTPNLRSLVSKQTGPSEQGIAQGCILGVTSFAYLISPIIYSPLSALFLSDGAPFPFPGFSIFCVGLAYLVGCILSIFIKRHTFSQETECE